MLLKLESESNIFGDISIINKMTNQYLTPTKNGNQIKNELTENKMQKSTIRTKIFLSPLKISNSNKDILITENNSGNIIKKLELPKIIKNIANRGLSTDNDRKIEIEKMRERIEMKKIEQEKMKKKLEELRKQKEIEQKQKKLEMLEEKRKLRQERERQNQIRKKLELIKREKEEEKLRLFLNELKNQKEIERQKLYELRKKLDIEKKRREEKIAEELKQISFEFEKQRLERINQIEIQRQQIEELKRINEENEEKIRKENEDKINIIIDELKMKSKKRKEIELKENGLENEQLKHKYRLYLLNELVAKYLKIYKSDNIIEILETIDKIGKLFKKEIDYDKEYCKDNFIYVCDANNNENFVIDFLGVLGEEFRKYGIYSIIEKKSEDPILMEGVFKVLFCVYSILPKYEIKLNSSKLNSKYLKEPKLWLEFCDNFKSKVGTIFNIDSSKMFIISKDIELFEFTLVILDRQYLDIKSCAKTLDISIKSDTLLEYTKLSLDFFENDFNRNINSWEKNNLKRGGERYFPPFGWKGYALKVLDKFDNGDNSWLGNEGKDGEWAIAYHGIGNGNEFKKLLNIVLNNLKIGPAQLYHHWINIRDKNNGYVGRGVYLAPDIDEAERYSGKINFGRRDCIYQFAIMCRVKPDKIREPDRYPYNWIVDDNYDCLRPYRILVKESK